MPFTCSPVTRALGALAIAALLGVPTAPLRAQDDPLVARANGVDIHESDLVAAAAEIGAEMQNLPPEEQRKDLINYVINIVLVAQAAEQQKLTDDPNVQHQLAFGHKKILSEALMERVMKGALTEEAMHKVYDDAVKQMPREEEVDVALILVATEDEAKAVEAALKKGDDFTKVAKEKSQVPHAARDGGELGWLTKDEMTQQLLPELAEATFKLDKGQISEPVHGQDGWYITRVQDKRIRPTPTFDQLKGQIVNFIAQRTQGEFLNKLRTGAKIEMLDQPAPRDPSSLNPAAPAHK
jgi:peptidyl-prolyl cis-trans isomerase C